MSFEYKNWINALPEPNGVLAKIQIEGRSLIQNLGIPSREIENWRLTDLKKLESLLTLPISKEQVQQRTPSSAELADQNDAGVRLTLSPNRNPLQLITLPYGIRELSKDEIKEIMKFKMSKIKSKVDWTKLLNHATANQIVGLNIKGTNVPSLELIMPANASEFSSTRIIINVEKGSKLELLEVVIGAKKSAQNHLIEINLEESAELKHGLIGLGVSEASLLAHLSVTQKPNSTYSLSSVQHGWSLGRCEQHIKQVEGQAQSIIRGLQISKGNEQLATHSLVSFDGPEGSLDQLQKSAAADQSHCIFNGAIKVPQKAQKTNAAQLSRNLLISENARIDTKPELEIIADDVRCTHGATVSQLQEDEIFYLQSRGITTDQATALLLKGYCQEILKGLPANAGRWGILKKLLEIVKR